MVVRGGMCVIIDSWIKDERNFSDVHQGVPVMDGFHYHEVISEEHATGVHLVVVGLSRNGWVMVVMVKLLLWVRWGSTHSSEEVRIYFLFFIVDQTSDPSLVPAVV